MIRFYIVYVNTALRIYVDPGCKTLISDVPSWGILSTKVKLDNEEDEDTTFVMMFDDKNTKLSRSMTKTIKIRCNI